MKSIFVTAICTLLAAVGARAAEPLANAVFTVGTTTTNGQGEAWVYLLWQPTQPNALAGHKIALYSKAGGAESANNYSRRTITQRQTDPLVIQSLLNRAVNVGDDLAVLETRINALFAAAVPKATLSLAEKISGVIRGAENDPQLLGNVIFLGRLHPSLNMCLGHAWMETVTSGKTTYEIRDFDAANNKDLGVIGRVTVDPATPIILPAPGMPVQYNELSAKGDLNIKLRWATPVNLREVGLVQHGFNIYRASKDAAEANNFHMVPPNRTNIATLLATGVLKKINDTPITVNKLHDALSALDYANDPTWYIADDNNRYKPGGNAFINGDQFYYFVTGRDLLGRDGFVSPGGLAIACDRLPPDAPMGLLVENLYTYNAGVSNQVLKINWKQSPNTNEIVTAYYVYRWTNATDAQHFNVTNHAFNRISGPIPHINNQTYNSYVDNGPGSPTAPADYGKTYWYTVRAADNGVCTNNLSPNSAPAFGVLRDRTAPGAPNGEISILCCEPKGNSDRYELRQDSRGDTNLAFYRFIVEHTNSGLAYAEFYFESGGKTNLIGFEPFSSGTAPLVFDWSISRIDAGGGSHRTFCRIFAKDDKATPLIQSSYTLLPPPGTILDLHFVASLDCRRVPYRPTPGSRACGNEHTPVDPSDGSIEPPIVVIQPPAGGKEYRLYRRVNFGAMTLIKQGPITNNPPEQITVPDSAPPANSGFVCYYAQILDEHGNAGPLTQLDDCLKFKFPNPKPLLSPLEAAGDSDNPKMRISWFCPPFGVERFEVFISPAGGSSMPADIASILTVAPNPQPMDKWVKVGQFWVTRKFYSYRTPRVGPQFGDGGFFEVTVDIELNKNYRVFIKPVGLDGLPDPDSSNSKTESFLWNEPVLQGPQVPWPARPLPDVATNNFPSYVAPLFINNTNVTTNFVGVAIVVGTTENIAHERPGMGQAAVIDGTDNPLTWIAKSEAGDSLFPCVVYRYHETNSYFPEVSRDIVQVTPMMERIAYTIANHPVLGQSAYIYDPFIDVYAASLLNIPGGQAGGAGRNALVLLDTQPVLIFARYRYIIVRFGENGEIVEIIPTASVDIQ